MQATENDITDLSDLRKYVHTTICNHHELELGVFPFSERMLARGGKPCGMFFCLSGPRSVKFTAIWETDRNTVMFYDSTGERVLKTQLRRAPFLVASDRAAG